LRRELNDAEAVIEREVGVKPPAEFGVEFFRAIDIRDGNYDRLELHVKPFDTNAIERGAARKGIRSCHISPLSGSQIDVQIVAYFG
jgi:hypothetical protein